MRCEGLSRGFVSHKVLPNQLLSQSGSGLGLHLRQARRLRLPGRHLRHHALVVNRADTRMPLGCAGVRSVSAPPCGQASPGHPSPDLLAACVRQHRSESDRTEEQRKRVQKERRDKLNGCARIPKGITGAEWVCAHPRAIASSAFPLAPPAPRAARRHSCSSSSAAVVSPIACGSSQQAGALRRQTLALQHGRVGAFQSRRKASGHLDRTTAEPAAVAGSTEERR